MKLVRIALWVVVASGSFAASAAPPADKVARAKAEFEEAVDAAFVKLWASKSQEAAQAGISAGAARAGMKWLTPAYSMGVCAGYLTPKQRADWIVGLDAIFPFGEGGMKEAFREGGEKAFQEGIADTSFTELTPDEQRSFCEVELAAIDEFLASP